MTDIRQQSDATTPAMQVTALTVTRGGRRILEQLTCTLRAGSIVGLIGPSGSGKSTFMRAIVGVQRITEGTLTIFGHAAGSRVLRGVVGYVSQSPAIYDDLTIEQNLHYFATLSRVKRETVAPLLERLQLTPYRRQLAANLSGGQRARVSLGVALLGNPDVLILDEPTVGLDPILREELWGLFATLAQEGKTLLISSHVMDEAERCEELLLLHDGKLLFEGAKQALLSQTARPTVEAAFMTIIKRQEDVTYVSR